MRNLEGIVLAALVLTLLPRAVAGEASTPTSPYAQWKNGISTDENYFPISVWLQDPKNAAKYKAAGINLFIGLWDGPTDEQLTALKDAGMPVICAQNAVGLKHKDDKTIVGWMHGDEPDNAQPLPGGKGYGPPILPSKIVEDYKKLRETDPTRPIILNLGQGVAWDGWYGRGTRTNKPEDYPEYMKGCDLVSFDIYPVVADKPDVKDKLWLVPFGVKRLREGCKDEKIVWDCIECTHISSENKATPQQVKAEVWMSLIAGARGLIYFVHEWKPKFNEHALLNDPEMLAGVTAINKQILALAPALNSPTVKDGAAVKSSSEETPIEIMVKKHGGATYVFAVGMRNAEAKGAFTVAGLKGKAKAEVIGEDRTLDVNDGAFEDAFKPYDVHLYKIAAP
ncbi:MAG: hypothetical protein HY291_07205 [Planctomycetes bacterium]|nr:hypothetical protein [Planctomycetota bacterium]